MKTGREILHYVQNDRLGGSPASFEFGMAGMMLIMGVVSLLLCLIFAPLIAEAGGVASYYDVEGTAGLSILAVDTSQCGGTIPNVTIDGGATQYAFVDAGSGMYYRFLEEGWYYIFQSTSYRAIYYSAGDTAQTRLDAIEDDDWVTTTRLDDSCVTSIKIGTDAVKAAHIAGSAVGSSEVTDGSLTYADHAASMIGTVTPSWTINGIEDTLQKAMGNWSSASDFTMGAMDSLLKLYNLGLVFAEPCTVRTVGTSQEQGIHVSWRMNSTHNDSSVSRFEVWMSQTPPIIGYGELTAEQYADIGTQMMLYLVRERPGIRGGGCYIPGSGWIWTVVIAVDWAGTYWASALLATESNQTGIGTIASLTGAPGFTAGMDALQYMRDLGLAVADLEDKLGSGLALARLPVFSDNTVASSTISAEADTLPFYQEVKVEAVVKRRAVFVRPASYLTLAVYGRARMQSLSEKGFVRVNAGGALQDYTVGGGGTASDTTWTDFVIYCPISGATEEAPSEMTVSMGTSSTNDTLMVGRLCGWVMP